MRLGEGGEAHQEISSMGTGLSFCRDELKGIVLCGDDPWWAKFRYALTEEEFEILRLRQRGTCHHPDGELAIIWNGRVSAVAVDRVDGDVGGELD
jgi:hypothetical protein